MEFKVGQKVVYPNYGVTLVEKVEVADWGGEEQDCYHLRLLSNNAQIMVPLINRELVGLRPLCGGDEVKGLFEILQDGDIETYKDWKGRYKKNLDKMRTGHLIEVAGVLKNLRLVNERKSLSFREKRMFERAKQFIVSEVAHVKKVNEDKATKLVDAALDTSLAKREKQAAAS